MDLDEGELRDLAAFFAKRFPDAEQRGRLASSAGLVDGGGAGVEAWATLLGDARVQGGLGRLAAAAASTAPADENLQRMCSVLRGRPAGVLSQASLIGMVAFIAIGGIGLGGWLMNSREFKTVDPVPEAAVTIPEPVPEPVPESVPVPAPAPEPSPVLEPVPVPAPAPVPVSALLPPTPASGRCTASSGGLVGYFYAGTESPGKAGETITLKNAINVRADYPGKHNGHDARTPLKCGLKAGDRIRLTGDPVLVPGNRYWVPLHSGDLLPT